MTTTTTIEATTTIWAADFSSGTSPVGVAEFVRVLERDGAVGTGWSTTRDNYRNVAGHPIRLGLAAHDDFRWAATRFSGDSSASMAAYYENGEAGPWWIARDTVSRRELPTTPDLIRCRSAAGCLATFVHVPARRWPHLCNDHAEAVARLADGWTPENSID